MSDMKRRNRGFTLVELVMVIVIIGVLAAIIVPKFSTQKDMANVAAARANHQTLKSAITMYYANEGLFPTVPGMAQLHDGTAPSGTVYLDAIPEIDLNGSGPVSGVVSGPCPLSENGWCFTDNGGGDFDLQPDFPNGLSPSEQYDQW